MRRSFVLCSLALVVGVALAGEDGADAPTFAGKVSTLRIEAAKLGPDWSGPTGLVVDDVRNPPELPAELRPVYEALKKQLGSQGVAATADYTYRRKSDPLAQATLRIFIFDDEAKCRAWWAAKYCGPGAEAEYRAVPGVGDEAFDAKSASKRAVRVGNVVLTGGSLKSTDDALMVVGLYLEKLKAASDDPAAKPGPSNRP